MNLTDWQVNTTSMIMVVAPEGAKQKLGAMYTRDSQYVSGLMT